MLLFFRGLEKIATGSLYFIFSGLVRFLLFLWLFFAGCFSGILYLAGYYFHNYPTKYNIPPKICDIVPVHTQALNRPTKQVPVRLENLHESIKCSMWATGT